MFSPIQVDQIYLIFNQLPFLWDTRALDREKIKSNATPCNEAVWFAKPAIGRG